MKDPRKNGRLELLIARLQAAVESGVIDVHWEGGYAAASRVCITDGELARLLIVLFPEEHREYVPPRPTNAPPGTAEKIRVMSERMARGLALFAPDADMRAERGRDWVLEAEETEY